MGFERDTEKRERLLLMSRCTPTSLFSDGGIFRGGPCIAHLHICTNRFVSATIVLTGDARHEGTADGS